MQFGEILKAMQSGVAYANIHTKTYGAGEIRGLIYPTDDGHHEKHGKKDKHGHDDD
jgi:CHRD domain-containing protein